MTFTTGLPKIPQTVVITHCLNLDALALSRTYKAFLNHMCKKTILHRHFIAFSVQTKHRPKHKQKTEPKQKYILKDQKMFQFGFAKLWYNWNSNQSLISSQKFKYSYWYTENRTWTVFRTVCPFDFLGLLGS